MSPPSFGHFTSSNSCLMYLHFGYPLQLMNSPYCPLRSSRGLPHFGQFSSNCPGGFCCPFWFSFRIVLHGGSSLYPGQAINGPHGPFRSTIVRPQLSQNSSSCSASCASGEFKSGLAAKFSLVKSQLSGSTTSLFPCPAAACSATISSALSPTLVLDSVVSSFIAFTYIGNSKVSSTFFTAALGS